MGPSTIVHVHGQEPSWHWLEGKLAPRHERLRWAHFSAAPRGWLETRIRRPALARYRAAALAGARAVETDAVALVSHLPRVTVPTELAAQLAATPLRFRRRARHLAMSFNFTQLPRRAEIPIFRRGLARVDTLVTYSTFERELYAEVFALPIDRIEVIRWGARPPPVDPAVPPPLDGPYVAAIGGEGRDYATLLQAARQLPEVAFVVIARPHNLEGLSVPPNVTTMTNVPYPVALAAMRHAVVMALPVLSTETPTGHGTLVAAMHLGLPVVASDAQGLHDYVEDGVNGLRVALGEPDDLARGLRQVLDDSALAATLSRNARAFATEHCSEASVARWFNAWLDGGAGGSDPG
ncbi:MAG TPA: glycosyltransferase family 4 protein [Polyangiaceae bacterium LLY-WYZ-14_1]|jgi:glycosyltransferase involved in cell wall biosynthesis|nr:glycosyltransferase family 4 protein [Polyangiaceae bacterium LLY-WYZ-14_1]